METVQDNHLIIVILTFSGRLPLNEASQLCVTDIRIFLVKKADLSFNPLKEKETHCYDRSTFLTSGRNRLMRRITKEDVRCSSCKYCCQLTSNTQEEILRCPIQKIAVWPGNNHFLIKGVLSLVAGRYESLFCRGCIFVDFSIHNLRYFTSKNWMDYLRGTGLAIIIISDRRMESLASFWRRQEPTINTVIYADGKIEDIKKAVNACYYGLKGGERKRVNALTLEEVKFLDLANYGHSLGEISSEMKLGVKKVYIIKDAVRRKTGINLNQLLSS
ncbi:hypothetical protein [Pantoea ananatis]|uniref:hypothetical protein n=1 Tax=Pantoea ananas TaxID=553 RepID=UPI0004147905